MQEPIVARYLRVVIAGEAHRLFFEEAGAGIPLLCLHTAGSDTRQFRHLMTDAEITGRFRVIAFDMPWHGKSSVPDDWRAREYRLTTSAYVAAIRAVVEGLGLEGVVALGCSMSGRIVLELARAHTDRFRAVIGLQSSAAPTPRAGVGLDWLHHPEVHGGELAMAWVSGLMAPTSPAEARWETLWTYAQGGPGVFKGDLHFYGQEGDFAARVADIDTRRCPVYLLTGEYDYSVTPADTRSTAALIPGARVEVMPGLGHFPMSENPTRFRRHLLPVLAEIAARPRPSAGGGP